MKILEKIYPWLLALIILALLVLQVLKVDFVTIDNTTIYLILLLILIPILKSLKRLKWGDFEAEIQSKDIPNSRKVLEEEKVTSQVELKEKNLNKSFERYSGDEAVGFMNYLLELNDSDPVLALAKLRIEVEVALRTLLEQYFPDSPRTYSIGQMIDIAKRKINWNDTDHIKYLNSLTEAISITNRAIHGEKIDKVTSEQVIKAGIVSLGFMIGMINVKNKKSN